MEFFVIGVKGGYNPGSYKRGPFATYEEKKDTDYSYTIESSPIHPPPKWALEQLTVDLNYDPTWGGVAYDRNVTIRTFNSRETASFHAEKLNRSRIETDDGKKYHFKVVPVCPHCGQWS